MQYFFAFICQGNFFIWYLHQLSKFKIYNKANFPVRVNNSYLLPSFPLFWALRLVYVTIYFLNVRICMIEFFQYPKTCFSIISCAYFWVWNNFNYMNYCKERCLLPLTTYIGRLFTVFPALHLDSVLGSLSKQVLSVALRSSHRKLLRYPNRQMRRLHRGRHRLSLKDWWHRNQ